MKAAEQFQSRSCELPGIRLRLLPAERAATVTGVGPPAVYFRLSITFGLLLSALCLLAPPAATAQNQEPGQEPSNPPEQPVAEEDKLPPGDWAVELVDRLANSPNADARDALYRAVMAAGPDTVPQLEAALKDDRTAEFAAQALAFVGGDRALQALWGVVSDPRDLNLRRFYYGALAEFDTPEVTQGLLDVIKRADEEPDRTVTEAAILALTVRSDPKVVAPLREIMTGVKDVVIRLDLENAIEVIDRRAKSLAAPQKKPSGSIEQAVRTYFAPALDFSPAAPPPPATHRPPTRAPAAKPLPRATSPPKPLVNVQIQNLTLTPDKTRALARVVFEDPEASAFYDIVLQKRYGDWAVASVWLGKEVEKLASKPALAEPQIE